MGATLYAALIMHSYIMSLVCCGIQVRTRLRQLIIFLMLLSSTVKSY